MLKGENGVPKGFPDKSVIKLKLELKILIVSTYVSKVDIVIPWMIILENHKDDKKLVICYKNLIFASILKKEASQFDWKNLGKPQKIQTCLL